MVRPFLIVAAVGLTVAVASPAAAQACAGADDPVTAAGPAAAGTAVRCLVDAERTARGVAGLTGDEALDRAAQGHAEDMLERRYFAHNTPEGRTPADRISAAGYDYWSWGENIAYGQPTPRKVVEAWMRSDGHCRNVLSPGFTELGLGIATGERILWVQNFGRPAGVQASGGLDVDAACPATGLVAEGAARPATAPEAAAPDPSADPAPTARPSTSDWVELRTRMLRGGRVRITGVLARAGSVDAVRLTVKRGRAARRVTVDVPESGRFTTVVRAPRGRARVSVAARPV